MLLAISEPEGALFHAERIVREPPLPRLIQSVPGRRLADQVPAASVDRQLPHRKCLRWPAKQGDTSAPWQPPVSHAVPPAPRSPRTVPGEPPPAASRREQLCRLAGPILASGDSPAVRESECSRTPTLPLRVGLSRPHRDGAATRTCRRSQPEPDAHHTSQLQGHVPQSDVLSPAGEYDEPLTVKPPGDCSGFKDGFSECGT